MKRLLAWCVLVCLLAACSPGAVSEINPTPTLQQVSEPVLGASSGTADIPFEADPAIPLCDPLVSDYCISNGSFIFQNPLGAPLNESIQKTYRYGSTDSGRREAHHGIDLTSAFGAPVFAAAGGEVIYAGADQKPIYSPYSDLYGNCIVVRHEHGLFTLYGHLSKILISPGQQVNAGDLIGEAGDSGAAIGSHLHFEVRRGGDGSDYFSTENPELWLALEHDAGGGNFGALSISLDIGLPHKVQRKLAVEYYPAGADTPSRLFSITTYPDGFEQNLEDAAISNLPPGRYRIALQDGTGFHDRWVYVEPGKLTQVHFVVK
jgi:murein DD-endopeptidase MepM/ murein hydrolase activator NlpD